MNKTKMLIFTVMLLVIVGFSTQGFAGPCDRGITLVNPLTGMVEINGVDIGNDTVVNTTFEIGNDGLLALRDSATGSQVNPGNRFNAATSQVELDCVVFQEKTFRSTLDLVQDGNDIKLRIADLSNVFDATLTREWTVDYSNSFANDPLILNSDGTTILSTFPGSYQISLEQILIDLGLSTLTGDVSIGKISGNFSHFGENGTFEATPSNLNQTLLLNNNRFQVEVDWTDPASNGAGEGILVTDDSAAFFFFDSSNVEILVRVLDACEINDHYWVFAGGLTNVEYSLTVTDTSTGTQMTYNAPTASPEIIDTSAFSTCP
jgi:hypothetical protein